MKDYLYVIVIITVIFLFCTLLGIGETSEYNNEGLEHQIENLESKIDYLKDEVSSLESKLEDARRDIKEREEYIRELEGLLDENVVDWDKSDRYLTDENGNPVIPEENKTNSVVLNKNN